MGEPDILKPLGMEDKPQRILAIDHNRWRPHVLTSFELLIEEALIGNDCFYVNSCDHVPFRFGAMYPTSLLNWFSTDFTSAGTIDKIQKNYGVKISHSRLPNKKLLTHDIRIQEILLEQILGTDNHYDIRKLKYKNAQLGYAIVSSIFERLETTSLTMAAEKKLFLEEAQIFMDAYEYSYELFRSLSVDKVVIFNGRFSSERASWEAAKELSLQVVIHEATSSGDYTCNKFGFHSIEGYSHLAKEQWAVSQPQDRVNRAESWFSDRRKNFTSQNNFSEYNSELELSELKNLNHLDKPLATLFNTSDREFYSISPEWESTSGDTQLTRFYWAAQELLSNGYFVVLRLHPNMSYESRSVLDAWRGLRELGVKVLEPKSAVNSYALMELSSVVVTAGSTTGVEAAVLGIKSILLGHAMYEKLGCVIQCNSLASFQNALQENAVEGKNQRRDSALLWGLYESSKWSERRFLVGKIDPSFSDIAEPSFFIKYASRLIRMYLKLKDTYFGWKNQRNATHRQIGSTPSMLRNLK